MACCFRTCCGWKKHPQRHGQTFAKIEHQQRHKSVIYKNALDDICSAKGNITKLAELTTLGLYIKNEQALPTKKKFLEDCKINSCGASTGCSPIATHLTTLTSDHVKNGWNVIRNIPGTNDDYETPIDRQDYNMLVVLDEITKNSKKVQFIQSIDQATPQTFFNNYFASHLKASGYYFSTKIGVTNKTVYPRNLELYHLDNFLNEYVIKTQVRGVQGYIKPMITSFTSFIGGSWGLGLLYIPNTNLTFSKLGIPAFEAQIDEDNPEDNHSFDIQTKSGINIETKNWATLQYIEYYDSKKPTKGSQFKTQLFSYLKNAPTIDKIQYVFKLRNGGITEQAVKNKMKTLFQTTITIKDENGNDVPVNALFGWLSNGNIGLLRELAISAGITDNRILNDPLLLAPEFKSKVIDNTNSTLYSFIKIQSDL